MPHLPRIALLVETSNSYARGLLRGVTRYQREHARWRVTYGEFRRGAVVPPWMKRSRVDGIVVRAENQRVADAVRRHHVPTVDLSAPRLIPDIPAVETDDKMIGRTVARHFLDRGFQRFGFVGNSYFNWSRYRKESFCQTLDHAGHRCEIFEPPGELRERWELGRTELTEWVRNLPTPIGIMAGWDGFGQLLTDVCRELHVAVPESVAIVGVDNDDVICELADPPLSSVATDPQRTGYYAAELLDLMMRGGVVEPQLYTIPPIMIVTRQSSDTQAIDDPFVARAAQFIRENACGDMHVDEVAAHVRLSRRALEVRFRTVFGHSPHRQIVQTRLQRVRELLRETDLSIAQVAARTGFKHAEYLSVVFKRETGSTPNAFRRWVGDEHHTWERAT